MKEIIEFKDRILNDPDNKNFTPTIYIDRDDFVNTMNDLEKQAVKEEIEAELDHLECFVDCIRMNPQTKEYFQMIISRIYNSLEKLG